VSYQINKVTNDYPLAARPTWMTDEDLYSKGIAPDDSTYAVSGTSDLKEVKTDYRFVRGHMCPKNTAERISSDAAYNTHTVLNACPQLQWQNNGIWKKLEESCEEWADKYGRIWVICGPVFFNREPSMWLGQAGEIKAAIPDAFYKIVIRESEHQGVKCLVFLIPNIIPKTEESLDAFLVSVDRVESLTGLDFLTVLEDGVEGSVERGAEVSVDW